MKKYLLLSLFVLTCKLSNAICLPGFTEVIVQIIPDQFPTDQSWSITDDGGNIIASGLWTGDTLCVPDSSCMLFSIYDSFGDGINPPGGYWLYVNGSLLASGNSFGTMAQHAFNCPQGSFCSDPLPLAYGFYMAVFDNTWYSFTPDSTGTYSLSTCNFNNCDTKIWIYSNCPAIFDETPAGTYAFNDNSNCGLEANLNVVLIAGHQYFIRMGDNLDDCTNSEFFLFNYFGPVAGCTDNTACNFDPIATVDDGSCIYFPNPLCAGPDLELDSIAFITSLGMMTENASTCDVNEGCVTGYGTRYVISFTSKINNIGTLNYYIGNPSSNPGMFNNTNCHGHSHYEGYGDYRLIDMNGNPVPVGHKNGFCVMDLCGFGQYNCGDMGISVGCYDAYGAGTQCQWVDITEVPDGDYRLAAVVNALHLPDAMGHSEINYLNNALQVCIHIQRNAAGVPSFTVLPNCTPFVDCLGIPGGIALMDCNGMCNGPSLFGDVQTDAVINTTDLSTYVYMLTLNNPTATPCNDLNGDNTLTVYDGALAGWCLYNGSNQQSGGGVHNHCQFPRNILNPSDTASLSISAVNFANNYIDVSIKSTRAEIKAYQFALSGITIQNVVSLANVSTFPVNIDFNPTTNEVFALSVIDSALHRSNSVQALCRIYFSAITDTVICISNIVDIVNRNGERINTQVDGGCISSVTVGSVEIVPRGNITLIPNPVNNNVFIHLGAWNVLPKELVISDATGRIAKIISVPASADWFKEDMSDLKGGVYLISARNENGTVSTVRFVKL